MDQGIHGGGDRYEPSGIGAVFADAGYCGMSFNDGLVRFHDSASGPTYRAFVNAAFPELEGRGDVLAFDWHGSQVVTRPGSEVLWLADPNTGELVEFLSPGEFDQSLKIDAGALAFDGELFNRWREHVDRVGARVPWNAAISYRVPLYAGGEEGVERLRFGDLDVLWEVTVQVLDQVRDLPPGTRFTIE